MPILELFAQLALLRQAAIRREQLYMRSAFTRLSGRDSAQGLVEYGLIIALVAVLAIAGLILFGPAVSGLLSQVAGSV